MTAILDEILAYSKVFKAREEPGASMTLAKRPASWLFVTTAAMIYSVIYFLSRTPRGLSHAALVSAAATFDLTITASIAFYFLLVRNGYSSWLMLITVALGGLRAAGFLLPGVDQQYLPSLKWVSGALELVAIGAIIRRFRRVQSSPDGLERIRSAASAIIPYDRLAKIVATEIAVVYYALFSWRSKPEKSPDSQTFSCGEASGYGLLGTLLILLIVCEGVPLHFVLLHYSGIAAWVWTGIDAYCLLWAVAIIRSVRLRTILVDEQSVKIRVGIVWETEIPRQDIVSCLRPTAIVTHSKTPGYLKAVVFNDPQYIVELSRPAVALGLYGQRRTFTQIGVTVDQGEAFASALNRE